MIKMSEQKWIQHAQEAQKWNDCWRDFYYDLVWPYQPQDHSGTSHKINQMINDIVHMALCFGLAMDLWRGLERTGSLFWVRDLHGFAFSASMRNNRIDSAGILGIRDSEGFANGSLHRQIA